MRPGTPGFRSERLTAAREARGIATKAALAELIDVTRAAVSQYELGAQTPAPEVMRRIAERLNLPLQFFLRPPSAEPGTFFFRSMASATKSERARMGRQFQWLRDIVIELSRLIRFPSVDVPSIPLADHPLDISDESIEDAARSVRRHWGLGDGPISNLTLLLENRGAVVSRIEFGTERLDAFSQWCPVTDRPFVVLGADKQSAVRLRANAAHELGHLVLHRGLDSAELTDPTVFRKVEDQAYRFGACLLLPRTSFITEVKSVSLDSLLQLKRRWGVAVALMIKRCEQLGLIPESHCKSLWVKLSRRGWKRAEPLDDTLTPEEPRFLRRCIEGVVSRGLIDRHGFSALFALPEGDIERIVGLKKGWLRTSEVDRPVTEQEPAIIPFPSAE